MHLQHLSIQYVFILGVNSIRLYTGCRLDQNFSKSIIGFQKVKVLNY